MDDRREKERQQQRQAAIAEADKRAHQAEGQAVQVQQQLKDAQRRLLDVQQTLVRPPKIKQGKNSVPVRHLVAATCISVSAL